MGQQTGFYLIMISGLSLLFYLTGIDNGQNVLLSLLLSPTSITTSLIYTTITSALISGGIVGVVVGFVTKNYELSVMSGLISTIFGGIIIPPLLAIYNNVAAYSQVFALLAISPMITLLIFTVIDWWRGRD